MKYRTHLQYFTKLTAQVKLEKDGVTITFGRPVLPEIAIDPKIKTGKVVFNLDETDYRRSAAFDAL